MSFAAVALVLDARRDPGAGILPERAGPARAGTGLRSSLGLAWRLQRPAFLGWLASFVVFGALLGNLASTASAMLDTSHVRELFTKLGSSGALTDSFLAAEMGIVGLIAAAYAVQAAMRLHSEEVSRHAEVVLAAGTSRVRWASSHIAVVGSAVLLLFGFLPRLVWLASAILIFLALLGEFGQLLKLNQTAMDLSPFTHVPKLPGGDFVPTPLIGFALIACVLVVVGIFGFRRRDLL